jgi:cytochrome b561
MAVLAGPELQVLISSINISVTILLVPVFVARLVYAVSSGNPGPFAVHRLHQNLTRLAHAFLYTLTSLVLLSGLLMVNEDIGVFGWVSIPQILDEPILHGRFAGIHRGASAVLAAVIATHIAAVIRYKRMGVVVLRKMLWGSGFGISSLHVRGLVSAIGEAAGLLQA